MKITDYELASDKTPYRVYHSDGANSEWVVLWLQGFTSTIEGHHEGVVRMAERSNMAFAMLNYAGHGNHPMTLGDATREQQLNEVRDVYDAVAKLGFKKFIVVGGSFGAYMAALLVKERAAETVVLRVPATYADEEYTLPFSKTRSGLSEERRDIWRDNLDKNTANAAFTAIRDFPGDVFVMEHELDTVVHKSLPLTYYALAKHGNYIVVRDCDHSPKLMPNPQKYFAIIENWVVTIIDNTRLQHS